MVREQRIAEHPFLHGMYRDEYFPNHLVDQGKEILLQLCERIEEQKPGDLDALYILTHAATEEFNTLEEAFLSAESEFETVAREEIAEDFWFIASTYGFSEADIEELIAPREW